MRRYSLPLIAFCFLFVACGPGAEEKAVTEKQLSDSIAAARAKMELAKEAARQQSEEDTIADPDTLILN